VSRAGTDLEVGLRAEDLARGRVILDLRERASGKGSIPEALDRLWDRARMGLGDAAPGSARAIRVAQIAPSEPRAWRHYDEGMRLWAESRIGEACAELGRAAEADPEFPLPHLDLARCSRSMEEHIRHFDLAMARLERLPPRERALVEARRALMEDRQGEARGRYQRIVEEWPEATAAYREAAAFLLFAFSDLPAARPFLERGLALRAFPPPQAVWASLAIDDLDGALAAARQASAQGPAALAAALLASVHRARGEEEASATLARAALEQPGSLSASLFWSAVEGQILDEFEGRFAAGAASEVKPWMLAALRGRWKEARGLIARSAPPSGAPDPARAAHHELVGEVLLGEHLAGQTDVAALRAEVDRMWATGSGSVGCFAHVLLLLGDGRRAEQLAGMFHRGRPDLACSKLYRAALAWKQGKMAAAEQKLAAMYGPEATYLHARVLEDLGRDREAVGQLRKFRRQFTWSHGAAFYAYPDALHREALLLERLGERDAARRVNDRLLRLWRTAEPDRALLQSARVLEARLRG
jgi:tetratricopeptide (TPR) repeat protein